MTDMINIKTILSFAEPVLLWLQLNWPFVIFGFLLLILWFAFQFLALHYWNFLREYKKPRLDLKRMESAERALQFHREEMERIYEQMGKLRSEFIEMMREDTKGQIVRDHSKAQSKKTDEDSSTNFESSFLSLGEIQLKQKIQALKNSSQVH